jgi:hypothetical protein
MTQSTCKGGFGGSKIGEALLAADGDDTEIFPVANYQTAVGSATKSVSLLQYCVKDRCEVARGGVDDLQYLGGRGLLLQRLARLSQQPRVLHRDDRLRRKIFEESDLFVGKRSHRLPVDPEEAPRNTILAQRDPNRGAGVAQLDHCDEPGGPKLRIQGRDIRNLDRIFAAP